MTVGLHYLFAVSLQDYHVKPVSCRDSANWASFHNCHGLRRQGRACRCYTGSRSCLQEQAAGSHRLCSLPNGRHLPPTPITPRASTSPDPRAKSSLPLLQAWILLVLLRSLEPAVTHPVTALWLTNINSLIMVIYPQNTTARKGIGFSRLGLDNWATFGSLARGVSDP